MMKTMIGPSSGDVVIDSKMTKSATGNHISPLPPQLITTPTTSLLGGGGGALGAPNSAPQQPHHQQQMQQQQSGQVNLNFPRGTRNRQTFHGKTDHNRPSGGDEMDPGLGLEDLDVVNNMTVQSGQTPGARGSFLSKLTKLTKRGTGDHGVGGAVTGGGCLIIAG